MKGDKGCDNIHLDEKKLFKYLLSDFLIHMQESLKNASEYKPQIALILARKPLIDDIYYLQLLLVNAKKAVNLVLSEDNSKDNFKKDDEKLSRQALDILKLNVETDNMFYKIRYGENGDGLLAHCNKASHIATSRTLNTNPGELNFVFLDGEGIEDYTVYYCEVIVTLLHYVAHMIAKIYEMQFKDISLKVALDLLDVGFIKLIREGDNNEE